MKKLQIMVIGFMIISAATAGADSLLFKGTNMALYTAVGSWSNVTTSSSGRVPIYGDTANIAGSSIAQITTAAGMNVGATVNVSNNAAIFRNGNSAAYFSGTLNFKDNSALTASQFALYSNAVFNWNSTGVWNGNGANAQANLYVALANGNSGSGPTINMSAGTWNLTGNSGANSFQLDVGTFTMTGGKIFAEDIFKMGSGSSSSRVNLGGTGEIYCMAADASIQILSSSILNFDGTTSALYVNTNYNIKTLLTTKVGTGNIYVDGTQITSIDQLEIGRASCRERV